MFDSLLINSINEGVVVTDDQGVIRIVNPALSRMFGYEKDELIGEKIEILIPNKHRKKHVHHREGIRGEARSRAMGADLDLSGVRKDGTTLFVEISLNPYLHEGANWMMAIVSDVNIRKIAEKNLIVSASFLKEAEKLANVGHYEINVRTGEMRWSDQLYRLFQVERDDNFLPTTVMALEFVHPEDRELVLDSYRKSVNRNEPYEITFRVIRTDGEIRYLNNTVVLHHENSSSKNRTLFGVIHDVTEQYLTEESLRLLNAQLEERVEERTRQLEQNQLLYKMIARNFPNGDISVFDKDLNYVFIEGKELFDRGITGDMLVGTSFLERVDPSVRDNIKLKLDEVHRGRNVNFELQIKNSTYLINAVPLPLEDLGESQILMVTQNITAQKQAEENIKSSLEKEQALNDLKSRFVSMASHEFRTPLTSILNSSNLINKYFEKSAVHGEFEDKQKNHLERIKKSTKHLTSVLNDFLSIDKLEHGKIEINVTEFDISAFAEDLIQDMDGIRKANQTIVFSHTGDKMVLLDRQMMMNVMNNLLSNALKYSGENGHVEFLSVNQGGKLEITVKDNGIGIPKSDQEHLFSRFFRATNVSEIEGTGLGLNIVKSYIELAGGSLELESEEKVGTSVKIQLPNKINLNE